MPKANSRKEDKSKSSRSGKKRPPSTRTRASPEYMDYLQRFEEASEPRRKLSAEEFEQLDDEFLELLELGADGKELTDEQQIRLNELEYLLLDSE